MFDIIIKNGTVIDGTGRPMFKADVGIRDDEIVKIGELQNERTEMEIDAKGKYVCPGFVDVNNHSDAYWQIFSNPNLESLLYQGITTIVGGNCGSSLAPLVDSRNIETIQKWSDISGISFNWRSMKEFLEVVKKNKLSVNFATLTGHGTIRRGIVGDQMKELDGKELNYLKEKIADSLTQGSLGVSTGLVYVHARSASISELIELAKTVEKANGIYVTHLRDEGDEFIKAVEEAIEVAKNSGVKIHISHLKASGQKNWELMDRALGIINKAQKEGIEITFDVYPYVNMGSVLYTLLPKWISDGGKKVMINRLRDLQMKAKAIEDMKKSGWDYSKIEILISSLDKTLSRKKISEIAVAQNRSAEEVILDVLVASEGRVIVSLDALSEENIEKAVKNPLSIISSNDSGYSLENSKTGQIVHPRSFGTFPRIFSKYVLKKKILKWEEAVRKMSGFPAEKFGIKKRGKIQEKYFADVAIISPKKIQDLATADNPYQYSSGIEYLLVNGKLAIKKGSYTGVRNGEVIKK